jgi:hypothetical protein
MAFPSSPVNNQTATVNGVVYIYAAATSSWARIAQGGVVPYTASATVPASPRVGDQWYNTTTDILYEYQNVGTGNFWVDVTSAAVTSNATTVSVGETLSPFLLMGA